MLPAPVIALLLCVPACSTAPRPAAPPASRPAPGLSALVGDGLAMSFDMGTQRRNWTHARHTVLALPQGDYSDYSGLRLSVHTDRPRDDVQVTVWLREEDGSWYYAKGAVPLVDNQNSAEVRFADFSEAEWCAPSNHMDEDYVLDLSALSHIAIGVINPLGVGQVDFTVTGLELLSSPPTPTPPAKATVTGKTLSVNGHNVVPAGIFAGYAGHLPQEYRPGCQRDLYPSSYPRVPRQLFVRFDSKDLTDWRAMLAALRGQTPQYKAVADHLLTLIDEKLRPRIAAMDPARVKTRTPEEAPRELCDALNSVLRSRRLYDVRAFAGVTLPPHLARRVAGIDALNDTEVMETNRRVLEATFGAMIRPVPEHGPTEIFHIDCFGERKEPAPLLWRADWKQMLEQYGRTYAANARKAGYQAHLEFWNEPYLNWAERSRTNLQTKFFDAAEAVEGGPVRVKYRDGPGPVIPHFKWVRGSDGALKVVDETAFSYWSGRGNGWIYDQMLAAVGPAIKAENPDVQVIAGWGFRWQEDHWAAWEMLYRPTIDRNSEWIDAIHEHHYQGDTTGMNGAYEVLLAYSVTKHGKWLYCYNTETNDLIDAPARGGVDTPEKARAATQYRRMVYNLRDLIYCVKESPDKARARTMIHHEKAPAATAATFGLLKDLRGRLIETQCDDDGVWVVASVDGTDPQAMPPQPGQTLVAVVFNDHREARPVSIAVSAPQGTKFRDGVESQTFVHPDDYSIGVRSGPVKAKGTTSRTFDLALPPRTAWKVSLPLEGSVTPADQLQRTQYFSPDILATATRGRPHMTTIALDTRTLAESSRAWARLVLEDVARGEGTMQLNGRSYPLPPAYTADNVSRIVQIPLDVATLTAINELRFFVNDGNHAGYRIDMASIVLERPGR